MTTSEPTLCSRCNTRPRVFAPNGTTLALCSQCQEVAYSEYELWLLKHCYDCGFPHRGHAHTHCFEGPDRPVDNCNCGGCRYARGERHIED